MLQNNPGILGGSGILGGTSFSSFGSGGLPHSSLMAYPPPLTNTNTSTNSGVASEVPPSQQATVNAGFQNRL